MNLLTPSSAQLPDQSGLEMKSNHLLRSCMCVCVCLHNGSIRSRDRVMVQIAASQTPGGTELARALLAIKKEPKNILKHYANGSSFRLHRCSTKKKGGFKGDRAGWIRTIRPSAAAMVAEMLIWVGDLSRLKFSSD